MTLGELVVVPAERHVERLAQGGARAETRTSLRARLAAALLPEVRFADAREARLTLAAAIERGADQLTLFGGAATDDAFASLRGRGGASWVRTVAALHEAIGALRARGGAAVDLERVRGSGVAPARAKLLAAAMRALDADLARAGARDERELGAALASALRAASPEEICALVSARRVRARWLLSWEPDDLAWWRALDEALARAGGHARIVLPTFDKPLESARERDPFEVIADVVARHLDAAPEAEPIAAPLGDLAGSAPEPDEARRVQLVRATDARTQARAAARMVRDALERGARVERVVIAYPSRDEGALVALRRALRDEGLVFHDAVAAPVSAAPVVAAALHALAAADSLERLAVARMLRSGYIDAPRLLADPEAGPTATFREAEGKLARLARALESRATAAGDDAVERLVRTAAERGGEDEVAARRVAAVLARAHGARTRGQRVRSARGLFRALGLAARAGRGALAAFAQDEPPSGVDRVERIALARDVRAWDAFEEALDAYEITMARLGALDHQLDPEVFRLELTELLDASPAPPGAGRAAAVRVMRLGEAVGEELDLLLVLSLNDGVFPRDAAPVTLVSEALEAGLSRVARGAFAPTPSALLAARDLAALAASAAEAARVVLFSTAEDGDGAAEPSRVFSTLAGAGVAEAPLSGDAPATGADAPPAREVERGAHDVLRGAAEVARRASRERTREGFFLDPARPLTELVGMLAERDEIDAVIGAATGDAASRALAVTSLERFAQCPFKGYANVVLAARSRQEQGELPDAREEGSLGHAALAAAFDATRDEWPRRPRDVEAILSRGLPAAEEALAAAEAHAPLRAIARMRIRESVRAVLLRAAEDLDWDFAWAEQAFGDGGAWPVFEVGASTVAAGGLWLRGTIDRVDLAPGGAGARVVDYKRSASTARAATSSLGEAAVQVPLYAAVASRRLGAPTCGAYLPMQARDLAALGAPRASRGPTPEQRVLALSSREAPGVPSEIERRALSLVLAARAGRLAPLPASAAECAHCDVSGGCRKPRFAIDADEDGAGEGAP